MLDKRLLDICPESKKYMAAKVLFQWLELACNALMVFTVAQSAQKLLERRLESREFWIVLALLLASLAGRFLATRLATRMSYLASRSVKRSLREMIYRKLLRLGGSYREKADTSELVQLSVEGVEQLESYFGLYVPQLFYAFLAPLSLFLLFALAGNWYVGAVLLTTVPLIPAAIMLVQKAAKKRLRKYWKQYSRLGSSFLENLQGMTTLKIYQADAFKNDEMNAEAEHFREVTMAVLSMQLNSITIMDLAAYGGAALGMILASRAFLAGSIPLGSALFMILLAAEFFLPMRRLGSYFHVAMNGLAASNKIFRFLSAEETMEKKGVCQGGELLVQDLSFSYDGQCKTLDAVNFRVPFGGFVGIVGASGSGKSTLAALLMGRQTPTGGSISLGGQDLRELSEDGRFQSICYVGCGSYFFKGSVRENLAMARDNVGEEAIWQVLKACCLDAFLTGEKGLETELLENAANLSGGQKQRLALARAILFDAPINIFDEATSNIDVESEEVILRQIRHLAEKKTVIMITHRLANVRDAEKIYCLEAGRIAESGRHADLLRQDGVYARLWETQQALEQYGKEAVA